MGMVTSSACWMLHVHVESVKFLCFVLEICEVLDHFNHEIQIRGNIKKKLKGKLWIYTETEWFSQLDQSWNDVDAYFQEKVTTQDPALTQKIDLCEECLLVLTIPPNFQNFKSFFFFLREMIIISIFIIHDMTFFTISIHLHIL